MKNYKQEAAAMLRQSADELIGNLQATPDDKIRWKPLGTGRSVLDVVVECSIVSESTATCLRTRQDPFMNCSDNRQLQEDTDTAQKATRVLELGINRLLAALAAFPEARMEDTVTMPRGGVVTFTELVQMVYWNNIYHNGQISYIQTLYGDQERYGY